MIGVSCREPRQQNYACDDSGGNKAPSRAKPSAEKETKQTRFGAISNSRIPTDKQPADHGAHRPNSKKNVH
jgi:hypothetical protein